MFILYDPDAHVTVSEHRACAFHQTNPDIQDWPMCTCSGGISTRAATPEEYAENRARRLDRERRKTEWLEKHSLFPRLI